MPNLDREHWRGVLLSAILLVLPTLSPGTAWMFFLAPLPVICLPVVHGPAKAARIIFQAVLIAGGISLLTGGLPILLLSASLLPAGLVLTRGLKRREAFYGSLLQGAVALALSWLGIGLLVSVVSHGNIYRELLDQIDQGLSGAYQTYSKGPDVSLDVQAELRAAIDRGRELIPKILPGLLATMTVFVVWLNMTLANWLLGKTESGVTWEDAGDGRLPFPLVWVFIVAGSALFVPGRAGLIGMNLMIVTVTLYGMQGFDVFNHLCRRWSMPNPIRGLILFFLVIQAYGFILLALLGLADVWAEFRKQGAGGRGQDLMA
ncbi:MAG: DUF2232 domain-containing protein [Desulfobacteraceae bacterium]|nr:DUF2232 domain-containing protein [Desulfobacteraceae bacterium]